MRRRYRLWAGILLVLLALSPGAVQAQGGLNYSPPATPSPLPLYSTRPEEGLFTFATFTYYRQTNPLESQVIALRGFVDVTGRLTGGPPGTQVTNGQVALDAGMVDGPTNFQPGWRVGLGYRFRDGSAIEASWMHLNQARYTAIATLVPPFFQGGTDNVNTFLSSPVYNYPAEFAGPPRDLSVGLDGDTFGIWNAADQMSLTFIQRNEMFDVRYRVPMYETECWRTYGMVGPRFVWFWESFRWKTDDSDVDGGLDPANSALYYNTVSNRMYGVFLGIGNEWYMGNGLAVSWDVEAAGFLNVVREIASYKRSDRFTGPANKRSRRDYTVVPQVRSNLNLFWYPIEGVQLKIGYDIMGFFNTVAAPNPVDFNYGGLTPQYEHRARFMDGFDIGVAISF